MGRAARDLRSAVSLGRGLGLLVPSGADRSSRGGGAGEEVDGVGLFCGDSGAPAGGSFLSLVGVTSPLSLLWLGLVGSVGGVVGVVVASVDGAVGFEGVVVGFVDGLLVLQA